MAFISQTIRPSSSPDILISEVVCESDVVVGSWVRIRSDNIAVNARADSVLNSEVFGLVEEKSSSTLCVVRVAGLSKAIFTGLDVTKTYFLSNTLAGTMGLTVPTNSGEVVLGLGRSYDGERFLVQPSLRLQRA